MKKLALLLLMLMLNTNVFCSLSFNEGLSQTNNLVIDTLKASGDISVSGNVYKENMTYGEMGVSYNSTAITIVTANVYYKVTPNVLAGESLVNCTFADSKLTLLKDGVYMAVLSMSFSGAANSDIHGGISVDTTEPIGTAEFSRKLGATGDVGCVATTGIRRLTSGQTVEVQVENTSNTNDITIEHMELIVIRIAP